MELCELLGRSFGSVRMKFGNFNPLDPGYPGKGLLHIKKLDRQVWDDFYDDQPRLRATAGVIKRKKREARETKGAPEKSTAKAAGKIETAQNQKQGRSEEPVWEAINDYENEEIMAEASEGKALARSHIDRERKPGIVRKKKAGVLRKTGRLACEACGFDFAETYGARGEGFIECHHVKPLSDLEPGIATRLNDLVLLCSNCHRMAHAKRPWLVEVKDIKRLIKRTARHRRPRGSVPGRRKG